MDTVTISKEEFLELVRDSEKLAALEAGGVSNWEWYDLSLEDYEKRMEEAE
jgi:hypothetical protein